MEITKRKIIGNDTETDQVKLYLAPKKKKFFITIVRGTQRFLLKTTQNSNVQN